MDLPEGQSQPATTPYPSEPESRPRSRRKGGPPARAPLSRLRCQKRRALSLDTSHPLTSATSERRNERERNRVKLVNLGFAHLRRHVPQAQGSSKKMSKVDTLRSAVDYIRELQELLGERRAPAGERLSTSDGRSPHGSSSADSLQLSPGSCSSSLEDGSQDSSTISDPDFFLTMHGWG